MGKVRTVLSCRECGQQLARWAGRCPGCDAWGTIEEGGVRSSSSGPLETLAHEDADERRVSTGLPGIDRVLGGGLVPSTVALLAGEPGISQSLSAPGGRSCVDRCRPTPRRQSGWLRVWMRSKMIKHNKDLLESVDDRVALLDKLHIY